MVHANAVIHGDRARLLALDPVEHPVALQLGGSEPALLAQAARIGADAGFDEINLNCGCPSDRVQAGRFGACLMREPALVADCVAAMIAACGLPTAVPVTVKCRLGVDDDHDYDRFRAFIDTRRRGRLPACSWCTRATPGCKGLSPKENREVPPLRYDWAYRLKRERPDAAGGRQRRHRRRSTRPTAHLAARRRRDARPRRLPRSLPAAPARRRLVRRRAAHAARELLRALRPYVEAQLARGVVAQAHHPPPARPVRRRARRPRVPPGAERRRAPARRRLVAGRAARWPSPSRRRRHRRIPHAVKTTAHDHPRHRRLPRACPRARARLRPGDRARRVPGRARRLPPGRAVGGRQPLHGGGRPAFDAQRAHRRSTATCSARCRRCCRRSASPAIPDTPDALFPNNVFATVARPLRGRPHAPSGAPARSRRATTSAGSSAACSTTPRSTCPTQPHPCELTGALVIDRARGLGFCGLSERCDEARRAADARGVRPARDAAVRPRAGRVPHQRRAGGAGRARGDRLSATASPTRPWSRPSPRCTRRTRLLLSPAEHAAFVGNAIALSPRHGVDERRRRAGADRRPAARALAAAGFARAQRRAGRDRGRRAARCAAASARSSEPRRAANAGRTPNAARLNRGHA